MKALVIILALALIGVLVWIAWVGVFSPDAREYALTYNACMSVNASQLPGLNTSLHEGCVEVAERMVFGNQDAETAFYEVFA